MTHKLENLLREANLRILHDVNNDMNTNSLNVEPQLQNVNILSFYALTWNCNRLHHFTVSWHLRRCDPRISPFNLCNENRGFQKSLSNVCVLSTFADWMHNCIQQHGINETRRNTHQRLPLLRDRFQRGSTDWPLARCKLYIFGS